jgi:transcriptional regulator with XRE-family HTH domain
MTGSDVAGRRRAAGLSQRALAAKLGVSQQWVAALERDVYPITPRMARRLRAALGEVVYPTCGGTGMVAAPHAAHDPDGLARARDRKTHKTQDVRRKPSSGPQKGQGPQP